MGGYQIIQLLIEENLVMLRAATEMNLEDLMLNKIIQSQKDRLPDPLICKVVV